LRQFEPRFYSRQTLVRQLASSDHLCYNGPQTYQERLATLEQIRQEYHAWGIVHWPGGPGAVTAGPPSVGSVVERGQRPGALPGRPGGRPGTPEPRL